MPDEYQPMFGQNVRAHFLVRVNYSRPESKIFLLLIWNELKLEKIETK